MADEHPVDVEVAHGSRFCAQLLDPVLAKVAETEGIDGAELALRVVLGDGKQADIRGTAAGAEGCSVDLLPDGGNVGA